MSADDVAVAKQFLEVLAAAANTGDHDGIYPFLAPDVEWLTPQRTLHGVDEVRAQPTWPWLSPQTHHEAVFDQTLTDRGRGRIVSNVRATYRVKASGEVAYARDRCIELTIREGKIVRYELRFG
jgi:ketosteroid isomerase-like protein